MKKIFIIAAAWLFAAPVLAGGMEFFHGSFEEALARAKAEKKLVFIDVYTTWCGPCKMMVLNVFPTEEVGEFFNAHFVNLKLDQEDKAVNGPEISARYGIQVLPTYLFIDPDGTEKHRGTGFKEAEAFINLARASLGTRQDLFSALEKRYQAGERKPEFIREYLKQARYAMAGEGQEASRAGAKKIFDEYVAAKDKKDLINAEDFSLLESYLGNTYRDNEYVDFVAHHYDAFTRVAPESRVAFFLLESVKHSVGETARKGDATYVRYIEELDGLLAPAYKVQEEVIKNDYVYKEYLTYLGALHYFTATKNWQGMIDNNKRQLAAKGSAATAKDYARVASGLQTEDPAILGQAVVYAKKAYELQPSARYALDYAGLLQKLNRNDEALQVAGKALANFDPKDGQAYIRQRLEALVSRLKSVQD